MRHFTLVNLRSGRCARLCCVSMLILMGAALLCSSCASSPSLTVNGPQGRLSTKVTLPAGFDTEKDSCMMVILMHGIFASKDWSPMPVLARELARQGIASVRFDFNGHGKSEGRMEEMTIARELADARAVWEAVKALPYVSSVARLGHSQGGAVASMLAGELANEGEYPVGLVLLAPGSIIKEATQAGRFFGKEFDPKNPPAYIKCFNTYKLGHDYLVQTQLLDIYGTAAIPRAGVPDTWSRRWNSAAVVQREVSRGVCQQSTPCGERREPHDYKEREESGEDGGGDFEKSEVRTKKYSCLLTLSSYFIHGSGSVSRMSSRSLVLCHIC